MTKKEATIIEAYTGICMLIGEDTNLLYEYASKLLGFPVFTHNLGDKKIQDKLKELSKPDFIKICENLTDDSKSDSSDTILVKQVILHRLSHKEDFAAFVDKVNSMANIIGQDKVFCINYPSEDVAVICYKEMKYELNDDVAVIDYKETN